MTDITIRKLAQDDVAQWTQLWAGYNAFYGRHGATALAREITETTWSRFFDPAEPVHALVAEHAGRLVGLAHYLLYRSTIQVQANCHLQDLYSVKASRGLGVGRMLIGAVYDVGRALGLPRGYWQTHESNEVAMQLYDKVADRSGFIVYRKVL